MTVLSPDTVSLVRDYLLPQVEASHRMVRQVVENFPSARMHHSVHPGGETLGDLLWYLVSAFHVTLDAVQQGAFGEVPAKPEPASPAAFLAWDEARFAQKLQTLTTLDASTLLQPLALGPFTQPAVDYLMALLNNVAHHLGVLTLGLQQVPAAPPPEAALPDELTDEQLMAVAGGNTTTTSYYNGIKITGTYHTATAQEMGWIAPPATQASLISLFGNGKNNQVGLAAVIPGMALGVGAGAWGSYLMFGTLAFFRI